MLPEGLVYLDLSDNHIEELKNLPKNLEYLLVVNTKINSIGEIRYLKNALI